MHKGPAHEPSSTRMVSRRHFVIGGALLAASGVAFAAQPKPHMSVIEPKLFESWIPSRFGEWATQGSSGVVLPPPDALSDRLYDNLVTRVYGGSADAVMLLLAYNNVQDGVLQVHRPEVCYPVGGYVLTETAPIDIPALGREVPSNVFTAKGPDRTEQVMYFTRLGKSYPRSWGEQRWAVIQENLAGRVPDGIMMRVSLIGTDRAKAVTTLRGFASDFTAAASPSLQKLLVV